MGAARLRDALRLAQAVRGRRVAQDGGQIQSVQVDCLQENAGVALRNDSLVENDASGLRKTALERFFAVSLAALKIKAALDETQRMTYPNN